MRQGDILKGFREVGPCTVREMIDHVSEDGYKWTTCSHVHTKVWKLCRQGFVRKVGERPQENGRGRPAPVWELVE